MATAVFSGYIIKAELKRGSGGLENAGDTHVEGYYQIDEIFKGKPNGREHLLDADLQSGNCSIGLTIGMKYIFFLDEKSGISQCSGTRKLGFDSEKDTELFDTLRRLKANAK